MENKKAKKEIIKKTLYVESDLNKKLKLQAILQDKTESSMLNHILTEYFKLNKIETK